MKGKLNEHMRFDAIISRYEYGVMYRLRNKEKLDRAMKIQDSIRKSSRAKKSLTKEIRKWRNMRYAARS